MYRMIVDGVHYFSFDDPRSVGYVGSVKAHVELRGYTSADQERRATFRGEGAEVPEQLLGAERESPKHFRLFDKAARCDAAGYDLVTAQWVMLPDMAHLKIWAKHLPAS